MDTVADRMFGLVRDAETHGGAEITIKGHLIQCNIRSRRYNGKRYPYALFRFDGVVTSYAEILDALNP